MAILKDLIVQNAARVIGPVYANSFVKAGGTSSQFLKADGSVDTNTYALSSAIPAAPGTLNTTATTAQSTNASEALSGAITLHKIAKTGTYSDLIGTPTIPTVYNSTITLQSNGTTIDSFTLNASAGKNIDMPNNLAWMLRHHTDVNFTVDVNNNDFSGASICGFKSNDTIEPIITRLAANASITFNPLKGFVYVPSLVGVNRSISGSSTYRQYLDNVLPEKFVGELNSSSPLYLITSLWTPNNDVTFVTLSNTMDADIHHLSIFLGWLCDTKTGRFELWPYHPIYYYDGTNFRQFDGFKNSIENLSNVTISNIQSNDILIYDSSTSSWVNTTYLNTDFVYTCSTPAATAAKIASSRSTNPPVANHYYWVYISTANSASSALTFKANDSTAYPIYINGTASSSTNYTLQAGLYFVYYSGSAWYFNTNGEMTIMGNQFDGTVPDVKIPYGICNSAQYATAMTVSASGFELEDGSTALIRFTNGIMWQGNVQPSFTLNINSTGAKTIQLWGSTYGLAFGSQSFVGPNQTVHVIYHSNEDSYFILTTEMFATRLQDLYYNKQGLLPSYSGNANKVLAVNSNADGLTWVTQSGGGGGGTDENVVQTEIGSSDTSEYSILSSAQASPTSGTAYQAKYSSTKINKDGNIVFNDNSTKCSLKYDSTNLCLNISFV